jgi:hypothetical protein
MKPAQRQAYEREVRSIAKRLGIPLHGDVEAALIRYAVSRIREWIAAHGQPSDLGELLKNIATSLQLEIVEVRSEDDIDQLLKRIPPSREPVLARVSAELDDRTDAVILQRQHRDSWEMPYLAAINCRGWHGFRRYYSKWHEVVHLLLDGAQLRFAFRKTSVDKKHPEEILVDKIAGVLAFYPEIFNPVLLREIGVAGGRLTFDVIERVRDQVAPEASREATLYACLRGCGLPVYFVKARLGYKRSQERQLNDLLASITDPDDAPQPKLRIKDASASAACQKLGIHLHENMEVPESSIVASTFHGEERHVNHGEERLELWRTSQSGPVGVGLIHVEAVRYGEDVWCLLTVHLDAADERNARPHAKRVSHEGQITF